MPELPEVETVVRGLRSVLIGRTISSAKNGAPPSSVTISKSLGVRRLDSALRGRTIHAIHRRGKNILISLSGEVTLWVHLKMTGRFRFLEKSIPLDKHDLVVFNFAATGDGYSQHQLRFHDYRRFGRLRVYRDAELYRQEGLARLGPEPLAIPPRQFIELCRVRPRMIKPALLEQSFIAGLGNIYADESLYRSRIHPRRLTTSLSKAKLAELHSHIQRVLRQAIKLMGTTVSSYTGVDGQAGSFQKYVEVYGREGQPCVRCRTKIVREKIGSRSAHYCPRCQRER